MGVKLDLPNWWGGHKLRVLVNRVLIKIIGPKEEESNRRMENTA
jgi:hypothetical protein